MQFAVGLFLLVGLAFVLPETAAARAFRIEVRSADGAVLGRVPVTQDERGTTIALDDVAHLLGGALRRLPDGDRLVLIARGKTLEARRGRAEVRVAGRPIGLSAPVRVREGRWVAPADLLARALPSLLGAGVQVSVLPDGPFVSRHASAV